MFDPQSMSERLNQACHPTYPIRMSTATTIVGVGTTGSQIAIRLHGLVAQAMNSRLPQTTEWLTIDADKNSTNPDSLLQQTTIGFISTGLDGAGSIISRGRELAEAKFPVISRTILSNMAKLAQSHDQRIHLNKSGAECQTLLVIAGSAGGTSGGTKDLVVTAGLKSAEQLGLKTFRVVVATVGGEMPYRDISRSQNADSMQRILANYAESAMWRYATMATHKAISVEVPGQGWIRLRAANRIATNLEFDWENEFTKLRSCSELIEMIASSLFMRVFTAVGCRRASRECDDVHSGRTGQQHPLMYGVSY